MNCKKDIFFCQIFLIVVPHLFFRLLIIVAFMIIHSSFRFGSDLYGSLSLSLLQVYVLLPTNTKALKNIKSNSVLSKVNKTQKSSRS